jgi:hypothetical protein
MSEDNARTVESSLGEGATGNSAATDHGATSHTLARTFLRATVGFVALGADGISAFVHSSVERGQQMQTDVQKLLKRYGDNAKMQARAAGASRDNLTQQAWTTLEENLQALKGMLVLSGSEHATTEQPSAIAKSATQGEKDNGDSSSTTEKG